MFYTNGRLLFLLLILLKQKLCKALAVLKLLLLPSFFTSFQQSPFNGTVIVVLLIVWVRYYLLFFLRISLTTDFSSFVSKFSTGVSVISAIFCLTEILGITPLRQFRILALLISN
nr:MAG TPA: hypothetical protein [Caudoviricetes sp.]